MNIGLIAMSGVRACNPELTALGLTLPGFVERNRIVGSMPSLGLLTLAALTPPSVQVNYIEVPDLRKVDGVPGEFDVVAISSFTAQIKDAYVLADRYRTLGTKVVLGGLHVSVLPDEALAHADAVVLGEGEIAWPTVIADLLGGGDKLRRVYDVRNQSWSLDQAPVPRYEILDTDLYNRLPVQTQRGCPYRCEFCAASILISPKYKLKPVTNVMAEIDRIQQIWPRPFVEFADDNTFVNKAHSKQLMRALLKRNLRWFTETDISVADDSELLDMMHDAGCAQVLIGLESTTMLGLDGLEKNSNWKARQLNRYMDAISRIQRHGITVNGCFVLGVDGPGTESFEQIWEFVRETGLYDIQITVQTPFPGTSLYQRLKTENRILREGAWELCTLFDVNFQPASMSVAELESGLRQLAAKLYSEDFTRERKHRFHAALRQQRRSQAYSAKEV